MRLPELGLGELRQQWRVLTKRRRRRTSAACCCELSHTGCSRSLSAASARSGSVSSVDSLQQLNASQEVRIRPRPELKPGTRLVREWQGRTYDVLVLDDGFSWQGTSRSLSASRKDHRHSVVGTALLRIEAEPHRCSQALAGTTFSWTGRRCRELTRAADVARSTPANPPRKGSSSNSIRSRRSAKPARPTFAANSTRVGCWRETAMTMAGSRRQSRRPAAQRLLTDIRAGRIDIVVVYKVDRLTRSLADFAGWSSSSTHRVCRSFR